MARNPVKWADRSTIEKAEALARNWGQKFDPSESDFMPYIMQPGESEHNLIDIMNEFPCSYGWPKPADPAFEHTLR